VDRAARLWVVVLQSLDEAAEALITFEPAAENSTESLNISSRKTNDMSSGQ
jgi:hypothetical protein